MENKVKPKMGDVWWNKEHKYGKIFVEVTGDSKVFDYVMFSANAMWSGFSPSTRLSVSDEFVYLFNVHDLIKDCIDEPSN